MLSNLFQISKKHTIWVVFLWLGVCPGLSFAGSTPLSAPMVPVQSSSTTPPQIEQDSFQNIEVKEAKGNVAVQRKDSDQFQSIQGGAVLYAGDFVKTGEGSCRLLIDGKNELRLGPNTELQITKASRNDKDHTNSTELLLQNGKLKALLSKLKEGSKFEVTTPTAIAAVRGTVLYLNVGLFLGQNSTQLYVDETHGGVLFKNTITGDSFLVPAFSLSNSFADGKLNPPQHLSSEQKDAFVKNWENPGSNLSQQFGIEEIPNPNASTNNPTDILSLPDVNQGPSTNDAAQDKVSEQNIPGANGLPVPSDQPSPAPSSFDDAEARQMIREEIGRIRNDEDFDHADAHLAQISDAQTGKVFTDVFGNRVRVDQYIFHDADSPIVQFLSLTARTGQYQNGVSALWFMTEFNRGFGSDVPLNSLPWNDYMNVVTREDLAARLGISPGSDAFNQLSPEYIVHEHRPECAEGDSALYPLIFDAIFISPPINGSFGQATVAILDAFGLPSVDIPVGEDIFHLSNGVRNVPVQGKEGDILAIVPPQGVPSVSRVTVYTSGQAFVSFDGGLSFQPKTPDSGDSGSQTAAFAAPSNLSNVQKLLDVNGVDYYRTLAVNNDGNPNNDEHPAYFDERLDPRLAPDQTVIGQNHLIGGFIPINDKGQIINQPGFRVRGLRDILSPNPLVGGGNYNLEIILMYGYVDGQDNSNTDLFHEDFRIDTIITPGIFQGVGNEISPGDRNFSSTVNNSSLFPAALHADDDDTST